jgi:hypothetical protein
MPRIMESARWLYGQVLRADAQGISVALEQFRCDLEEYRRRQVEQWSKVDAAELAELNRLAAEIKACSHGLISF